MQPESQAFSKSFNTIVGHLGEFTKQFSKDSDFLKVLVAPNKERALCWRIFHVSLPSWKHVEVYLL